MASDTHGTCEDIQPLIREATRGGLDAATRERVYAHLAACESCRRLADEERALDHVLEHKLPRYAAPLALKQRLQARLPAAAEAPPAPSRRRLLRWAAPALAAGLAAVLVVGLRGPGGPSGEPLVAEAVADHLRVVYREHPVDIESGGPHQVKPWFTGRLDFALPTVFGGDAEFPLQGGAVGVYLDRRAAMLVYKHQLHTISLFIYRADGLSFPKADRAGGRLPASVRQLRGFSVIVWRDGELGYSLVSDLNATDLLRLATKIAG